MLNKISFCSASPASREILLIDDQEKDTLVSIGRLFFQLMSACCNSSFFHQENLIRITGLLCSVAPVKDDKKAIFLFSSPWQCVHKAGASLLLY